MSCRAKNISHWYAGLYGEDAGIPLREPLPGSLKADVAIVGAGYTGLWTAYELLRASPSLKVIVLEARFAGYGASGRNGGAAVSQMFGSYDFWARAGNGIESAKAMRRQLVQSIDAIGSTAEREGIDCAYGRHGVLFVLRTQLELDRFAAKVQEDYQYGAGAQDSLMLSKAQTEARVRGAGVLGAHFSPNCASLDPARLVRGLAEAVERLGGRIYEQTRVQSIVPHQAISERGTVTADYVIRATEAYSGWLEGHKRTLIPIHTNMIATEVVPDAIWDEIGWQGREAVFASHHFLHIQHTADHRITIGGDDPRPMYYFGSPTSFDRAAPEFIARHYYDELIKLFPPLKGIKLARSWGGVFGAPRDWAPSVGVDHATGLGWGGGHVGDGVAASNMAGRTLRDLILQRDSELATLPWVRKHPADWPPEPLRWIGARLVFEGRWRGEEYEKRTGRDSRLFAAAHRLGGLNEMFGPA